MAIEIEPTFLALGAIVFVVLLVFILRSAPSGAPEKPEKPKSRKVKAKKEKKPKKSSLKKNQRGDEPSEWDVDESNEEEEVLEFLKGKDAKVIAKELAKVEKRSRRGKTQKAAEEPEPAVVSESEDDTAEGYEVVARKASERKEKDEKASDDSPKEEKKKKKKPFFKPVPKTPEQIELEKKQREEEREANREARRKEAEERRRENAEETTHIDRPRRTFAEVEHIKYEEASVDDILNSITQSYKPTSPVPRHPSIFTRLKRTLVHEILSYLDAKDLVALSRVNQYFKASAREESLWEALCKRQFQLKGKGKARTWRAAYRAEHRKAGGTTEEKKD